MRNRNGLENTIMNKHTLHRIWYWLRMLLVSMCAYILLSVLWSWLDTRLNTPAAANATQSNAPQKQGSQNSNEATTTVQDYKYGNVDFRVTGHPLEFLI